MTAQDRHYMVDVDDANLHAFLAWHRDAERRGVFQGMSWYSQLKMAYMAAKNSLPRPEYKPSRDVLPPAPREPVDPFARASFTGPQQAAMDRLYPLPPERATPRTWSGEPVRIEAPPTAPMRVVPFDFELAESFDPANLPIGGPGEDV